MDVDADVNEDVHVDVDADADVEADVDEDVDVDVNADMHMDMDNSYRKDIQAGQTHCWPWLQSCPGDRSELLLLFQDLPINVKFVLEGMEEAGSVALEEVVRRERLGFFASVDYIVISDNLWLSRTKPALTYGSRGNSYFTVEVLGGHEVLGSRGSSPPRGHGALGPGSSGGLWHVHFGGIHKPSGGFQAPETDW